MLISLQRSLRKRPDAILCAIKRPKGFFMETRSPLAEKHETARRTRRSSKFLYGISMVEGYGAPWCLTSSACVPYVLPSSGSFFLSSSSRLLFSGSFLIRSSTLRALANPLRRIHAPRAGILNARGRRNLFRADLLAHNTQQRCIIRFRVQ